MQGVFEELFSYRPREGVTPSENFLTQALAHVLRTERPVLEAFVELALGEPHLRVEGDYVINTQLGHGEAEDRGIPDMQVQVHLSDGRQVQLICEHKWGAPVDAEQLRRYSRALPREAKVCKLVLISTDRILPKGSPPPGKEFTALTWSVVRASLGRVDGLPGSLLPDLLQFLDSQGLGRREAISLAQLKANAFARPLIPACESIAEVLVGADWSSVPAPFRAEPPRLKNQWGRLGVQFNAQWDKDWKGPGLFLGFLVDPDDHGVEFTDQVHGLDLMLAIDRDPSVEVEARATRSALKRVREAFPGTRAEGLTDLDNRHRLLMVRASVARALPSRGGAEEQVQALHDTLAGWCKVLFEREDLERALAAAHPKWKRSGR